VAVAGLTTISISPVKAAVSLSADGTGSTVNVSALTSYTGSTAYSNRQLRPQRSPA